MENVDGVGGGGAGWVWGWGGVEDEGAGRVDSQRRERSQESRRGSWDGERVGRGMVIVEMVFSPRFSRLRKMGGGNAWVGNRLPDQDGCAPFPPYSTQSVRRMRGDRAGIPQVGGSFRIASHGSWQVR